MKKIREKKHRLPREVYRGILVVSYTKCVKDKKQLFTNLTIFRIFERFLLHELKSGNCEALVYLFMPDHVHLILKGKYPQANSLEVMYKFSQKTGYWLSSNSSSFEWQKDFFDHIIRKEENIEKHIRYVLNNPVRKKLVEYWKDYPYKGSTVFNFDEWD